MKIKDFITKRMSRMQVEGVNSYPDMLTHVALEVADKYNTKCDFFKTSSVKTFGEEIAGYTVVFLNEEENIDAVTFGDFSI